MTPVAARADGAMAESAIRVTAPGRLLPETGASGMLRSIRPHLSGVRRAARAAALAAWLCLAAFACGGGGGGSGSGGGGGGNGPPNMMLEAAFGGINFSAPVKLVQHPDVDDRWYVVEQGGKIWTFLASNPAGTKTLVLDVVAAGINIGDFISDEQGLLGLAFDPDFGPGGELYITYTDEAANDSILARYESADDDGPFTPAADPIVLAIPHPQRQPQRRRHPVRPRRLPLLQHGRRRRQETIRTTTVRTPARCSARSCASTCAARRRPARNTPCPTRIPSRPPVARSAIRASARRCRRSRAPRSTPTASAIRGA